MENLMRWIPGPGIQVLEAKNPNGIWMVSAEGVAQHLIQRLSHKVLFYSTLLATAWLAWTLGSTFLTMNLAAQLKPSRQKWL
jgi:hypothetical protein